MEPAARGAVGAALEACLLTEEEMAGGEARWAAMADPFAEAWEREAGEAGVYDGAGHDHEHAHSHDHAH